jgi:hypothetical protein
LATRGEGRGRWEKVGRRGVGGLEEKVGRAGKKKGGRWAAQAAGPQGLLGHELEKKERRERRERRGLGSFVFQTFTNSHFKLLKLNSFQNTPRSSKHF